MPNDPQPRPRRKSSSEMLDELLEQQRNGTFVDPVESARKTLGSATDFSNRIKAKGGDEGELRELERLRNDSRVAPVIADALKGGLLPAAFLGGPAGMGAGALLGLDSAASAIADPSAMNVSMAALSALPFAKALRGAKKLAPEIRPAVHGPSREPGFYRTGNRPNPLADETMMFPRGPKAESPFGAPKVTRLDNATLQRMNATEDAAGIGPELAMSPAKSRLTPDQPDSLAAIDELLSGARNELASVPQGRIPKATDDFVTGPKMARDRIDPALREEAQSFRKGFGFKKLPKISRSENDRIAANIRRARGQD